MNRRVQRLTRDYALALRKYLTDEQEAVLAEAYELGRRAVAGGVAMLFLTGVLPFAGVILSRGAARVLSAFSVLAIFAAYAYRERYARSGTPLVNAALHPVSACVFAYAMLRSVLTILADGGIEWRGTRYPLEQLQRNAV